MAISDIRNAVKTLLAATTGVEIVNDLDPFNHEPGDFWESFVVPTTGKVNGWCMAIREDQPGQRLGMLDRRYEIRIRGLIGYEKDERSRAAADAVVEAIIATFAKTAANRRLPYNSTATVHWTDTPSTQVSEARVRTHEGTTLCHDITITFFATKEEALS